MKKNTLGQEGEAFAVGYLENKGYRILVKNWRYRHLEVDIIAQKYDFISIVEVKTRSTNYFGFPESFVDRKKMQNLVQAADSYLQQNGLTDIGVRFEVIALTKTPDGFEVEHIEEAFNSTHAFGVSPY